jgi:hypothetical protein
MVSNSSFRRPCRCSVEKFSSSYRRNRQRSSMLSMLSRNIFDFSLSAIKFCAPIQNVKKFFMASCTLRIMQPPPTTASFSPGRHLNKLPPNNRHQSQRMDDNPSWEEVNMKKFDSRLIIILSQTVVESLQACTVSQIVVSQNVVSRIVVSQIVVSRIVVSQIVVSQIVVSPIVVSRIVVSQIVVSPIVGRLRYKGAQKWTLI